MKKPKGIKLRFIVISIAAIILLLFIAEIVKISSHKGKTKTSNLIEVN